MQRQAHVTPRHASGEHTLLDSLTLDAPLLGMSMEELRKQHGDVKTAADELQRYSDEIQESVEKLYKEQLRVEENKVRYLQRLAALQEEIAALAHRECR